MVLKFFFQIVFFVFSSCSNARWTCEAANEEEIRPYNETNHIKEKCNELQNQEFTFCEPEVPITCKVFIIFEKIILNLQNL